MEDLSAEQRAKAEELARKGRAGLGWLCKGILGMEEWGELHNDIERFLRWSGRKKLILVPRGHLKSSVVTIGHTIQSILRNGDIRILIGNAVWDNARKFMWKIQEYMTDKSILPFLYGDFVSKRWTQDEFVVKMRRAAHAEPTVSTTGVEKVQTSQHYDRIVLDDVVVRENIGTREQIEKVINFYRDTGDLLEPGGELIVIGTRWAMGDLYQHIIENESSSVNGHFLQDEGERKVWRDWGFRPLKVEGERRIGQFDVYIRAAIEKDGVIFPEKFSVGPGVNKKGQVTEDLISLKASKGAVHFASQQMNDPVDEDSIEFKRQYYKEVDNFPQEGLDMMYVDPAFTMKQSNDATGIVITRFSNENIVYVMEAVGIRRDPTNLVNEIFRLWEKYPRIVRTKIESNVAQLVILTLLRNEMKRRNQFYAIEEYRPPNYEDKVARIRGLIPRYEAGGFRFRKGLIDLKNQMIEFPRSRRDDIIDAFSQGLSDWGTPIQAVERVSDEYTYNWWAKKVHRPKLTRMGSGFYDIVGRK